MLHITPQDMNNSVSSFDVVHNIHLVNSAPALSDYASFILTLPPGRVHDKVRIK